MPAQWPREFKPIPHTGRFAGYLSDRGFNDPERIGKLYNLKGASTGRYKDRVIFPLYNTMGELVGWTGRAIINPRKAPRYLASSEAAKTTVYNYNNCSGGKLLFIVEGPFDALKIDWFANHHLETMSVNAVALMGTSMTISQLGILRALCKRYLRVIVLLDRDAFAQAAQIAENLAANNVRPHWYKSDLYKDPSEMTWGALDGLFRRYGGMT